jgi:hypothetical protein
MPKTKAATKKKVETAKAPKPVTIKVEDLIEGDVLIVDGNKRAFGYRYQSAINANQFNIWLLDGKERWLKVNHGEKVKIVKREES